MAEQKLLHQWTCPHKKVFLLKSETILLAAMVFLVFSFSFVVFDQRWFPTAIMTLSFILVFVLAAHLLRIFYPVQETYQLDLSGISIHRQTGKKSSKIHIKYQDIKNFKLDKFFHGGRIEVKNKRHSLYFNTKKEIEKLEKILKKKIKR